MMNLVSRCRVRDPTVLASTASESQGITKSESQKVPLSLLNVHSSQNGRCSRNCLKKSKIRNVQIFGYLHHDTNGLNHGPVWKTQSFLLREICMVILGQDCCGKGSSTKFYWNTVGRKVPNWECFFVYSEKGLFFSLCVGTQLTGNSHERSAAAGQTGQTRPDTARHKRGLERAGLGRTRPDTARQTWTRPDTARHGWTRPDTAARAARDAQGRTGPHIAAQGQTSMREPAEHCPWHV